MRKFFERYWILIVIVAAFAALRVLAIPYHGVAYWDAAVYTGMGKYLFSHGTIGTWEILRPVALPIILGTAWKLGFNPYTIGVIFSLLISSASLVIVYFFAEEIREGSGAIAAMILAGCTIFFTYSAVPITDITSVFFSVLSLWLVYRASKNWHYLIVGLVAAIAFMFRFPQGLSLPVTMVVVFIKMFSDQPSREATARRGKGKWQDRIVQMLERVFIIAGGFCIIAVPFLVINYYFYGNAFLPFVQGVAGINNYPSLYNKGLWFYFVQLLKEDFFFIFSLVHIAMLWKKEYRSRAFIAVLTAIVIIGGYFIVYQAHKEIRYALAFLPYVAILAGGGVMYVLEWTKMPRMLFFGLFLIAAFMLSIGMFVYRTGNPEAPAFYKFDTFLKNAPEAHILTTSPYTLAYTDVFITHNLYADWNAAYSDYNSFRSTNDYIMLNSCSLELGCADDGGHCTDDKQKLLDELNTQDTKVFSATTPAPKNCVLQIYKINH